MFNSRLDHCVGLGADLPSNKIRVATQHAACVYAGITSTGVKAICTKTLRDLAFNNFDARDPCSPGCHQRGRECPHLNDDENAAKVVVCVNLRNWLTGNRSSMQNRPRAT